MSTILQAGSNVGDSPGVWNVLIFVNKGSHDIKVKNLTLSAGMLYPDGDMSTELSPSIYEDHIIHPQARLQLNTCGKEPGQRTSTTGQLDIVDVAATTKISHIYWDCKYGSPDTTWSVSEPPINDKWMVKSSKPSLVGALGTVTTEFIEKTTGSLNASPAVDSAT